MHYFKQLIQKQSIHLRVCHKQVNPVFHASNIQNIAKRYFSFSSTPAIFNSRHQMPHSLNCESINPLRSQPIKLKFSTRSLPKIAPITLTQTAIDQLKLLLKHEPDALGIKIDVKRRGCNGLSHTINYLYAEEYKHKTAEVYDINNILIYIPMKAQFALTGTEMHWKSDLLSSEFVFNHPKATTCGCGESFTIND